MHATPAHDLLWLRTPDRLLNRVADALHTLWRVDVTACPFLRTPKNQLCLAPANVHDGKVDLENVEPETFGPEGFSSPDELQCWLQSYRHNADLVFSYGYLSLPNWMLNPGLPPSFIDLGRSGGGIDGMILPSFTAASPPTGKATMPGKFALTHMCCPCC